MPVAVFCRILRSRWHNFARLVWPQTARECADSEMDRLDEELRRGHRRLLHCRQKIEVLRDSLERRQRSLGLLAFEMRNASADDGAVERVERRQRTIDRLEERLRERERAYERLRLRFRLRMRLRADLRDQLLSPLLARGARHDEIESDPDYPF